MKKLILMIAGLSLMTTAVRSQDANTTDLRGRALFGLKAGGNYSNVYDSEGEFFNADPKAGLAMGAFVAIPVGKYLGIQPELLFSQKGFRASGQILGNSYYFTRTTNFIDVPLLFAFKPGEFLTLVAGPQYSYLLSQKDVWTNSSSSFEQEQEFNNDNIRKNILCLTGGIDLTLKHIVLSARAGWDIQNNNGDGTSSTPRYKNVWYQGTIGYRFYSN